MVMIVVLSKMPSSSHIASEFTIPASGDILEAKVNSFRKMGCEGFHHHCYTLDGLNNIKTYHSHSYFLIPNTSKIRIVSSKNWKVIRQRQVILQIPIYKHKNHTLKKYLLDFEKVLQYLQFERKTS